MLQTLLDGLLIGGIYAIIALGLTLIFGVMHVINMAHGEFVMIGMFISYFLFSKFGMDPFISMLFSVPVCFAIGYFLYRWFVEKAKKSSRGKYASAYGRHGNFICQCDGASRFYRT